MPWQKIALAAKAAGNRAALEADLRLALSKLEDMEGNLREQLVQAEKARMILEDSQESLAALNQFMEELVANPVVVIRKYLSTKLELQEMRAYVQRQNEQLNTLTAVIATLRTGVSVGHQKAELLLAALKQFGQVIPWKTKT